MTGRRLSDLTRGALVVLTLLAPLGASGWAATPDVGDEVRLRGDLTLEDALKTALVRNRALQATVELRAAARGRVLEAWGEALPKVTADAAYNRADDVTAFEIEGRRIAFGKLDTYSAGLTVEQPIFRGGSTMAALRAARLYRSLTDETVRAAVQATIYQAASDYYRVVLLTKQLEVAQSYFALTAAHLQDVETKRRFGVASDFNVLRAQVERSNAEVEKITIKNQLDAARAALFRTLGVSQNSDAQLTTALDYQPMDVDESAAVDEALARRPDLIASSKTIGLQEQAVSVAKSGYWPEVDATFRYGWARPDPYSPMRDEWGPAWRLSITARYPLFDGLRREGRVAQAKAALRQSRIEHEGAHERVLFEVRTALQTLQNATQAVDAQDLTLEQAAEGLRIAEVSYREGALDQVSVLDARNALTQARLFHVRSLHAHAMAKLDLWRATGVLSPVKVLSPGFDSTTADPAAAASER